MPIKIERQANGRPSVKEAQRALRELEFVDVPTLAAATEQAVGVIREAIGRGEIKVIRLGRSIRIPTAPLRKAWGLDP